MATETAVDPLQGIDEKSTKAEILDVARKLATQLRRQEDARLSKLQMIEKRVREKAKPGSRAQVLSVMVSASTTEWEEADRFLAEFEDLLPTALVRLLVGGRAIRDGKETVKA